MVAPHIEVHGEFWYHALVPQNRWRAYRCLETSNLAAMEELAYRLAVARIHAVFYMLGDVARRYPQFLRRLRRQGHRTGSHGMWHGHGEREGDSSDLMARQYLLTKCVGYRSPYWETTPRPGVSGGLFFRLLPWWGLVQTIERSQVLWLHPHDLDYTYGPWWRTIHWGNPWTKLNRLLTSPLFGYPA